MLRRRLFLILCLTPLLFGQSDEIRAMMTKSQAAWNRGDLVAFAADYEDSPDTTFIGKSITHGGTQAILERYQKSYSNREIMGTLSYSELAVRTIAPNVVIANGKWDLKRSAAGGGDASGRFTLVIRKTEKGWKIIHDHSS